MKVQKSSVYRKQNQVQVAVYHLQWESEGGYSTLSSFYSLDPKGERPILGRKASENVPPYRYMPCCLYYKKYVNLFKTMHFILNFCTIANG
jgi:hypothetical protein